MLLYRELVDIVEPNSCNKLVNFLLNAKFVELSAGIILLRRFPRGSCYILLITPELKGCYQLAYSTAYFIRSLFRFLLF